MRAPVHRSVVSSTQHVSSNPAARVVRSTQSVRRPFLIEGCQIISFIMLFHSVSLLSNSGGQIATINIESNECFQCRVSAKHPYSATVRKLKCTSLQHHVARSCHHQYKHTRSFHAVRTSWGISSQQHDSISCYNQFRYPRPFDAAEAES